MTFDVSSDDWQAYLKEKIMSNIERYFYLIVFAMYVREVGVKGFPQTFQAFMDANSKELYLKIQSFKLIWIRYCLA